MVYTCNTMSVCFRRTIKKNRQARPHRVKIQAYPLGHVEDLHDERTPLADLFGILLESLRDGDQYIYRTS